MSVDRTGRSRDTYNVFKSGASVGKPGFMHVPEVEAIYPRLVGVATEKQYDALVASGYRNVVVLAEDVRKTPDGPVLKPAAERLAELKAAGYPAFLASEVPKDVVPMVDLRTIRNFFLTTDRRGWGILVGLGGKSFLSDGGPGASGGLGDKINVVLQQDVGELKDDGSMSIFCAKRKPPLMYVNIECAIAQVKAQQEMFRVLGSIRI
jgi:hypothetical protein